MRALAIAIVVAVTTIAGAEPAKSPEAGELFLRARDLAKLGRFTEACALFTRSYDLEPALGTAVNLADCLEREGQLRRAWELFDVVARDSQNNQSRARLARARADLLLGKLATVVITVHEPAVPGLALKLGAHALHPAAEIHELIEPGEVALIATVPGHPAYKTMLHAAAAATVTADIPAFGPSLEPVSETRRRRSRVVLAGGLGVAGVASLGASLGFAIASRHSYDQAFGRGCTHTSSGVECVASSDGKALIDTAGHRADLATGFAIGGAVLAGVAAAVFLTAPTETLQLAPVATSHALGVGIAGRF